VQIVREGQDAPDDNGTFSILNSRLTLNDDGYVAFLANLANTAGGPADDTGFFLGDGLEIITAAREGQSLAGSFIAANIFSFPNSDRGGRNSLNESGQVAYGATLNNGQAGIFLFTPALRWRTPGNGNWDDDTNWTLGLRPGAVHPVAISPDVDVTVTGPATPIEIRGLTLGAGIGLATLALQSGGDLTVADGVTIEASGVLAGNGVLNGDVSNGGIVSPGMSVGALVVNGDYDQTGELVIEIDSETTWDTLVVSGNATLGGDLTVELMPGFVPASTDEFEIMTAASITGTFATVTGPRDPQVTYEIGRVVITFPCAADTNGDGLINVTDLLALLAAWGPNPGHAADINNDGNVNVTDLLALLAAWGACP